MTLLESFKKDKLTLISLYSLVRDWADQLGVSLAGTMSQSCFEAGVPRTQIYEKRDQIERLLSELALPKPGRPRQVVHAAEQNIQASQLREKVLKYRLAHPGAVVEHDSGQFGYSDGFKRFILDLSDTWAGVLEHFSEYVKVPYQTLAVWQQRDRVKAFKPRRKTRQVRIPESASQTCRTIVEDYSLWEGSLRDFFGYEARRMNLPKNQIRQVLVIGGLLPVKTQRAPRYRGSTERIQPGDILVTDGKAIEVVSTATGIISTYNWQAMVDQATACHTAGVITNTECAQGVVAAFDAACTFMDKAPLAIVHDGKPIYKEAGLREVIEKSTVLIEATAGRGENKAVVEGEFGKFASHVGPVFFDDRDTKRLKRTAVNEVVRAYTAGINHAGRAEFDGKSRVQVLREACPSNERQLAFLERLRADHNGPRRPIRLPTEAVARKLLDQGFEQFKIEHLDPKGKLREWLSRRFTPAAIRQALAIFGSERDKGRLKNKTAHRYLVKLIQNSQHELDLRQQEKLLLNFAKTERQAWLEEFEREYEKWQVECSAESLSMAFRISESAVFGSLFLQRAFWEEKLKSLLNNKNMPIELVCNHVRRLWEAPWLDRFELIDKIVSWQYQTAAAGA